MNHDPQDMSGDTTAVPGATGIPVDVVTQGMVASDTIDLARSKLGRPASHIREDVRGVRVRVIHEADPARDRPWRIEACIDVDGTTIRSHASAAHSNEAVDLVAARLQRRVERYEDRRHRMPDRRRAAGAGSGEWRHGDAVTPHVEFANRPPEEREIVRRKVLLPQPMSVDEASFDREMLDHAFYLFTDEETGQPAVVRCGEDGMTQVERHAPRIGVGDARELLELGGESHVLFCDADSGAGSVLYRRHDGNYGLLTSNID